MKVVDSNKLPSINPPCGCTHSSFDVEDYGMVGVCKSCRCRFRFSELPAGDPRRSQMSVAIFKETYEVDYDTNIDGYWKRHLKNVVEITANAEGFSVKNNHGLAKEAFARKHYNEEISINSVSYQ